MCLFLYKHHLCKVSTATASLQMGNLKGKECDQNILHEKNKFQDRELISWDFILYF